MFVTMICQKKITIYFSFHVPRTNKQKKRKWVEKINEKKVCLPNVSELMRLMDSLAYQSILKIRPMSFHIKEKIKNYYSNVKTKEI